MNKRSCVNCNKQIMDGIRFCPFCGAEQIINKSSSSFEKNPFEILQITPEAEDEVIDAAYKSLAKKYHPDSLKNGTSEERMKELNWAFSELNDPTKRKSWKNRRKSTSHPRDDSQDRSSTPKKNCPFCDEENDITAKRCSFCDIPFYDDLTKNYKAPPTSKPKRTTTSKSKKVSWVPIIVIVGIVFGIFYILLILLYGNRLAPDVSNSNLVENPPTSTTRPTPRPTDNTPSAVRRLKNQGYSFTYHMDQDPYWEATSNYEGWYFRIYDSNSFGMSGQFDKDIDAQTEASIDFFEALGVSPDQAELTVEVTIEAMGEIDGEYSKCAYGLCCVAQYAKSDQLYFWYCER